MKVTIEVPDKVYNYVTKHLKGYTLESFLNKFLLNWCTTEQTLRGVNRDH